MNVLAAHLTWRQYNWEASQNWVLLNFKVQRRIIGVDYYRSSCQIQVGAKQTELEAQPREKKFPADEMYKL
jgi:hypothetical protein